MPARKRRHFFYDHTGGGGFRFAAPFFACDAAAEKPSAVFKRCSLLSGLFRPPDTVSSMFLSLVSALALLSSPPSVPQEGPISTAAPTAEAADSQRFREAVAYANPMPRGAPEGDYPLVAWCEALVNGHVALGESLTNADPLDQDIIRLGKLEAVDFRAALQAAEPRQNAASRAAARAAAAEASAKWAPLVDQEEAVRSQAFGLFFGLPGRCEHAARRLRDNITTPPATPADVGLE